MTRLGVHVAYDYSDLGSVFDAKVGVRQRYGYHYLPYVFNGVLSGLRSWCDYFGRLVRKVSYDFVDVNRLRCRKCDTLSRISFNASNSRKVK